MANTLMDLLPGQSAVIERVGNRSGPLKRRLVDMGITPGTLVTVRKMAPFGDPIEINIRGYELSLRKDDAAQIGVKRIKHIREAEKKLRERNLARVLDEAELMRMRADHDHELDVHSGDRRPGTGNKIALVGNPNSGKTTLFNALTGSNQYVGNWPGVTVEKKEGTAIYNSNKLTIVDLPGIYSLSPYSMEEIVARDFIINERPDAIINIIDATNIERNMYLTIQLLELERPMVLALNFMDEVEKQGDVIDCAQLSKQLGIPVVPITARSGVNVNELLHEAHKQMHMGFTLEPDDLYDDITHEIHHHIGELIHDAAYAAGIPAHWAAIKLLEGDTLVQKALKLSDESSRKVEELAREYENAHEMGDRETLIADSRYSYIEDVVGVAVKKGKAAGALSLSDKIDRIVTHRILAVPLFLLMMLIVFSVTFGPIGTWLSDGVDMLINGYFASWVGALIQSSGAAAWIYSLVVDGIIAGVGGVLTFLPKIALLFLFLSLLEDSGYMARAAFIMDRPLRRFGLSGKAFIPMLMGFGCTVPAVMGARTMENEKDRRMTIMLVPFMSCSAKLPVYGLLVSAFFAKNQGFVVFSLYLLGILVAVASGLLFKKTLFKKSAAPFVMELPPYRWPTLNNTLKHVWERVRGFIVRAGTIILVMSVVLWFLQSFDSSFHMIENSAESILGNIGGFIAPIFKPLGFGTWQAAVALLTGLVAKEAVVSSMSLFYGFTTLEGGAAIAKALSATFTPLAAYAFIVFVLLYIPCIAAMAAIRREMNSAKWAWGALAWQLGIAYLVSLLIYQGGLLLGLG